MFKIDFSKLQQVALSTVGAALLTIGAFAAAAGPAQFDTAPVYAEALAVNGARA